MNKHTRHIRSVDEIYNIMLENMTSDFFAKFVRKDPVNFQYLSRDGNLWGFIQAQITDDSSFK